MLRNYYINKGWMVSGKARRIYRTAAILSLVLLATILIIPFAHDFSEAAFIVFRLVILAGIVGAATTLVAMEYFWFGFDKSGDIKKLFWFVVLLFPLIGPAVYCLTVYSRLTKPTSEDRENASSATA